MFKKYRFNRICKRIKEIKIQGASNVARAALKAYSLFPSKKSKKILLKLRPTEPMLSHVLELADKKSKSEILSHFSEAQNKINRLVFSLIKDNYVIFTHCHSTNVIKALIYAKKQGRVFKVYNTETRPLFQGRKTSKELSEAGIDVTEVVDSAAAIVINSSNLVFLGADALLKDSVINKVGSGMFAEIAKDRHIPVYIIADSWKYSHKKVKLEQRTFREVWGTKKVHIKNPAFEPIALEDISRIISELGNLSYKDFLKKVKRRKD
jgi:translation initiation factor 2B subunit (eIF-2B alpha/beta/delta family)